MCSTAMRALFGATAGVFFGESVGVEENVGVQCCHLRVIEGDADVVGRFEPVSRLVLAGWNDLDDPDAENVLLVDALRCVADRRVARLSHVVSLRGGAFESV